MPNPDGTMTAEEVRAMMANMAAGAASAGKASAPPPGPQQANVTGGIYDPNKKGLAGHSAYKPASGSDRYGTTYGMNTVASMDARTDWANTQSGNKPWLSQGEDAQDTRNNYYYAGVQNGAANMNSQISGTAQGLAQDFGKSQDQAAYWAGQNGAMRDAGQALGSTFSGRADAMGGLGGAAAMRAPGQFLDSNSMQNNQTDRGYQVGAINGLNKFIANGPGPSAAQAQLNQATDANMQNSLAMARSGRGMGQSAGALRQAIGQNAVTGQQAANQSAMLKAQEAQQWQQAQLGAYGQIGNAAAAARQGDVSMGSYLTGSQQAGQNAADQASQGYYGLQGQFGQQQLGALAQQQQSNAQGLQASQLGLAAQQSNAQTQMQALQAQNNVNMGALQGNSDYENNLLNYYRVRSAQPVEKGTDYSPLIAAGATILGTAIGGPGLGIAAGAGTTAALNT